MSRLQRIMDRAEKLLREQEAYGRLLAQVREAQILDLVDAPPEDLIALSRTVHEYDDTADQAEGYKADLDRIRELYEDAERRWEAGEGGGDGRWEEARKWRGEVLERPS